MKRLIELAKKMPIDVGQRSDRWITQGKVIARDLVPPASAGQRALDVGCRQGDQTRWLEQKGYTVTSIDVEKVYDRAEVVDADQPLPHPDDHFDLLWCSEVIEHLDDPGKSIGEFRRVVKPGGLLVITTPNSYVWFHRALSVVGLTPKKLQNTGHKHFFDLDAVRGLFPRGDLYGYFPYALVKRTVHSDLSLSLLTPTFVIREQKPARNSQAKSAVAAPN